MKIPTLTAVALAAIVTLTGCGGDEGMSASEQRQALRDKDPHLFPDSHYAPDEVPEISQEDRDALADAHSSFHSEPYAPKPEPKPANDGLSDSDLKEIGELAIELAWNDMNFSEQENICWLFDLDEGAVLDAFMDAEDNVLSRSDVRSFFARKC